MAQNDSAWHREKGKRERDNIPASYKIHFTVAFFVFVLLNEENKKVVLLIIMLGIDTCCTRRHTHTHTHKSSKMNDLLQIACDYA